MNLMHKITVNQASLYFETKDVSKLTSKLFKKSFELKFVNEFNKMFSGTDANDELTDRAYQLTMQNRAYNLYYSLHEALRYALIGTDIKLLGKLMNDFKDLFGRDFKGIEDLRVIRSQMDHFKNKYEDTFDKKEDTGEFNFEQMIYFVETVSSSRIDRKILLFQFNNYLQNAITNARRNKTIS